MTCFERQNVTGSVQTKVPRKIWSRKRRTRHISTIVSFSSVPLYSHLPILRYAICTLTMIVDLKFAIKHLYVNGVCHVNAFTNFQNLGTNQTYNVCLRCRQNKNRALDYTGESFPLPGLISNWNLTDYTLFINSFSTEIRRIIQRSFFTTFKVKIFSSYIPLVKRKMIPGCCESRSSYYTHPTGTGNCIKLNQY